MSAQIIPIVKGRRALVLQLDQLAGYEGVKILSGLIREYLMDPSHNGTFKNLARKANLTPTTVSNIASGHTKAPRMNTCIMMFKALGFSAVRLD